MLYQPARFGHISLLYGTTVLPTTTQAQAQPSRLSKVLIKWKPSGVSQKVSAWFEHLLMLLDTFDNFLYNFEYTILYLQFCGRSVVLIKLSSEEARRMEKLTQPQKSKYQYHVTSDDGLRAAQVCSCISF